MKADTIDEALEDIRRGRMVIVRDSLDRVRSAVRKPYAEWLDEAYYVVHLREVREGTDAPLTGSQLLAQYGREISQVIRGEIHVRKVNRRKSWPPASLITRPTSWSSVGSQR